MINDVAFEKQVNMDDLMMKMMMMMMMMMLMLMSELNGIL